MAYDSRSSHPRNHGNRYYRDAYTAPVVMPKHEALVDQMLAALDEDAPAKPGLKRLRNQGFGRLVCEVHAEAKGLERWEAELLYICNERCQYVWERPLGMTRAAERAREEEEIESSGLLEAEEQRETFASWELGLPEGTRWSSAGHDLLVEDALIPDVEHNDDAHLDYEPWIPYMTQEEFMDHMDGGWHTGGWHVVSVR